MKKTLRIVSLVLSLLMLLTVAVMPVYSVEAEVQTVTEKYQRAKKIATLNADENIFAASSECYAIDNVIYNANGKKVNEIPIVTNNEYMNLVVYLDGGYAYTMYMDAYHDEGWYGMQLLDAFNGKVLGSYTGFVSSDWERGFYSWGDKLYIDGELKAELGGAGIGYLGGDMFLTLTRYDTEDVGKVDDDFRLLYNIAEDEPCMVEDLDLIPLVYFDGLDNGWGYTSVEGKEDTYKYYLIDRKGNKIGDRTYSNMLYDSRDNGVYVVTVEGEAEGIFHLIDNSGEILHTWNNGEEIYSVYKSYVITKGTDGLFRIYDRDGFTTDGKTFKWLYYLDENSFTVGDGSYDAATDTPDYIYYNDGTVTETDLNCLIPVREGRYVVSADYKTGIQTVYDREFNEICVMNENYEDVYGLDCDDILLAETKDGKFGFVSYKDEILIPFDYDATMTVDLMQKFSNGNLLVSLGYTVDGVYYNDLYLITYHDTVFTDVKNGAWFVDAVNYVYSTGLMNGKSDTVFAPNEQMTRAQLVTVLWRMAGSPEVEFTNRFSDIKKESAWYAPGVMWAAENGIVDGFPDGTFGPNESLTRDQLAAILYRYTEFAGGDVAAKGDLSTFTDEGKIQKWARPAVEWAVGAGIISGKPDGDSLAVAPKAYTTRAEVATVMMRYLNK